MKKNLLLLAILFSLPTFLFSQITVSSDSVQVYLDTDNIFTAVGHTNVKNNYDYTIIIKWIKGNHCNADDWAYSICDVNNCYFATTIEKEVELMPGAETNIDLHFNTVPASETQAIMKVDVINLNDSLETLQILYYVNTVDCEGTAPPVGTTLVESEKLQLFPNPVADKLHIVNSTATEALIYDITGRLVSTQNIINDSVDTNGLNEGMYQIVLKSPKGAAIATKTFVKI